MPVVPKNPLTPNRLRAITCIALLAMVGWFAPGEPTRGEPLRNGGARRDDLPRRLPPVADEEPQRLPLITDEQVESLPPAEESLSRLPPVEEEIPLKAPVAGQGELPPPEESPSAPRAGGSTWWRGESIRPLRAQDQPWSADLDTLLMVALSNSEHIRALSLEPLIQETEIGRQAARFDAAAFLESKFRDINEPVGNTLITGGPSRFLDQNWENRGGLRQKNWHGGEMEVVQEAGLQDTNSVFFVPANQANTRLVLSYTQPLMRGRGRCYNESLVVLAVAETAAARAELQSQLQDHLSLVAEGYWRLCLERARLVQQRSAATSTEKLLRELEKRRDIDLLHSHVLRAKGAVAKRRAAVLRAEADVRNQETRLWALTSAPELDAGRKVELVPVAFPSCESPPLDREASVLEAMQWRPEVTAALQRIQAAHVQLGSAQHELMPALNLVLETYARGLKGDFNVGESWASQFTEGRPSYSAGLVFEMPLGNAAARARLRRRELEVRQLALQWEATLKNITADVDTAIRNVQAAQGEVEGQSQAAEAARAEWDYLMNRWRMLPGEDRSLSLLIDEALDALDRLVDAEGALAEAQVECALSLTKYKRSTGQLLRTERVTSPEEAGELISRKAIRGTGGQAAANQAVPKPSRVESAAKNPPLRR
jgi:outer membrane protein TolC